MNQARGMMVSATSRPTMVEDLVKSDGFKELIYTSTSHCFMRPKDFEPFLGEYTPQQEKALYRDPQPSTWDQMIKKRDGLDSGGGVGMFRHTKDGRVRLKRRFRDSGSIRR